MDVLISRYRDRLRNGLLLKDVGGYNLAASEMNPAILDELLSVMFDLELPPVIWEPFAGRTKASRFQDISKYNDVELISQTLHPIDPRIREGDSMKFGPGKEIGGVLFHPPYFGSSSFFHDERDACEAENRAEYLAGLDKVVQLFKPRLVRGGLVCAVGRDYRVGGQRIWLPEWYLELFGGDFSLREVWLSEPDVVIIFEVTE